MLSILVAWAVRTRVSSDLIASVAQLTAFVTTVTTGATLAIRAGTEELKKVRALERKLSEVEASATSQQEVRLKEAALATAEKKVADEEAKLRAADAEVTSAKMEVERIDKGGLLYDFVKERRNSETYQREVGFISAVRRDLEELEASLRRLPDQPQAIGRIVLYVDDLDRCDAKTVMAVLQAVHLLLAFPLFHVVVGVDPRWLASSLRDQLKTDGSTAFSTYDYLEKIFQIPYSLSPISESTFKAFVAATMRCRDSTGDSPVARELAGEQEPSALPAGSAASAAFLPENTAALDRALIPPAPVTDVDIGPSSTTAANSMPLQGGIASAAQGAQPPRAPTPPLLQLFEPWERDLFSDFHELIDRPRLAKRFLNIYKLIRTEDHEGRGRDFAGSPESPGYKVALTLLAIQVRYPQVARDIFASVPFASDFKALAHEIEKSSGEAASVFDALSKLERRRGPLPPDIRHWREYIGTVRKYSFGDS